MLDDELTSSRKTYGEIFDQEFPRYLAIGMTPHQYWDEDVSLVRAYREADKIRQDRYEQELWLEGLYMYHVMALTAPAFNSLKPREPQPYPSKLLTQLYKEPEEAMDETKTEEERIQPGLQFFIGMAMTHNKNFKNKGGDGNGRGADSGPTNKDDRSSGLSGTVDRTDGQNA